MKLSDGERHSSVAIGKRYRLAISPVVWSDFGNYSCVSENALGKVRGKSTQVTLTGKFVCCLEYVHFELALQGSIPTYNEFSFFLPPPPHKSAPSPFSHRERIIVVLLPGCNP